MSSLTMSSSNFQLHSAPRKRRSADRNVTYPLFSRLIITSIQPTTYDEKGRQVHFVESAIQRRQRQAFVKKLATIANASVPTETKQNNQRYPRSQLSLQHHYHHHHHQVSPFTTTTTTFSLNQNPHQHPPTDSDSEHSDSDDEFDSVNPSFGYRRIPPGKPYVAF